MSAREDRDRYKARVRSWFREFKRHCACLECGLGWPAELHFHHVDPGTKDNTLAHLVQEAHSERTIIAELEKCVVLCRDCHAKVHGIEPEDFKRARRSVFEYEREEGTGDATA